MNENYYRNILIINLPRALSLADRRENMVTSGCFDRNFWKYKKTPYSDATFQQLVFPLTVMYQDNHKQNPYYNNENLFRLIKNGILFWCSIQHKKGYFNEWYANERSHVATSFTTWAVSESYLALKNRFKTKEKSIIESSLKKAGAWLLKNDDLGVMNHTAGSLPSLFNLYLIFKDKSYLNGASIKMKKILSFLNNEGWLPEYGGADPGYLNVSLCYFARYFSKKKTDLPKSEIKKILEFLAYMIHPDASFGGEYGNRNIKYLLPSGIQYFAKMFGASYWILKSWHGSSQKIMVHHIDDKYFAFFFLPDYASALLYSKMKISFKKDFRIESSFQKYFKNAGILVRKSKDHFFITNMKKGGPFKYFYRGRLIYSENSVVIKKRDQIKISMYMNKDQKVTRTKDHITFSRHFIRSNHFLPRPFISGLWLIFNSLFLRFEFFSHLMNQFLKKWTILANKTSKDNLQRTFIFKGDHLEVKDLITMSRSADSLSLETQGVFKHIPTSEYFILHDLTSANRDFLLPPKSCQINRIFKKDKYNIILKERNRL
ncbi:MAG: hypothetical protein JW827_12245 [Spirochaetes bacterium]|nr:hypothetical protein [Spirochaetota bacterium]